MKLLELTMPSYLLPALFNGDTTGLDEDEVQTFESWKADRVERHGYFYAIDYKSAAFFANNDYDRFAADCREVMFRVGRHDKDEPFVSREASRTLLEIAWAVRTEVNRIQDLPDDVHMSRASTKAFELADRLHDLLQEMADGRL